MIAFAGNHDYDGVADKRCGSDTSRRKTRQHLLGPDAPKMRRKGLWCAPTVYTSMCRKFQDLAGEWAQAVG